MIRRSVEELLPPDLVRHRRAIYALRANGRYEELASVYGSLPSYSQHGNLLFLPWNRAHLAFFERALAEVDRGLAIPWWDWNAEPRVPEAFALLEIDGLPNTLAQTLYPSGTSGPQTRAPGSPDRLPTAEQIASALSIASFERFSSAVEDLHNLAHAWVGGAMAAIQWAAYDPLFWTLQATIDRLWRLWQARHSDASIPSDLLSQALPPFPLTVADTLDPRALGYDYDLDLDLAVVVGATGAVSDAPAAQDNLGFRAYAAAFAELISSTRTEPPLTIGIFASWGMGKSSLLRLVIDQLVRQAKTASAPAEPRRRLPVHVVEFNAWDYSASDVIWPALVRKTMDRLEQRAGIPRREKIERRLKRNLRRQWRRHGARVVGGSTAAVLLGLLAVWRLDFNAGAVVATLGALGVAGVAGLLTKTAASPLSNWVTALFEDTDYGRQTDLMTDIRDDLTFLHARLAKKGERLLITIDDLDRCEPEKAVEVLQAVNLLLNFRDFTNFVVCLGIDARIVTAAIDAHYHGLLETAGASGYEYLDKIIQIPFRIPEAAPALVSGFLQGQLPVDGRAQAPVPGEPGDHDGAGAASSTSPGGEFEHEDGRDLPDGDEEPLEETSAFSVEELAAFQAIAPFLRPNPRHLKRLVNVYRLVRTLAQLTQAETVLQRREAVIRWLVISAQWPYTARAMLARFARLTRPERDRIEEQSRNLLLELFRDVGSRLDAARQAKLDDDIELLERLLREDATRLAPSELVAVQPFTINFNPAVAEEPGLLEAAAPKPRTRRTAAEQEQRRRAVETAIGRFSGITVSELAHLVGEPTRSVSRLVKSLEEAGVVQRHGAGLALRAPASGDGDGAKRPRTSR